MKIVLLVIVMVGAVIGNEDDLRVLDSIVHEQPCLKAGGMCTLAEDCPVGLLAEERGLCPTQRSEGVECCYGVSLKETRCEKHGGGCKDYCNPRVTISGGKDCPKDQQCCLLVL